MIYNKFISFHCSYLAGLAQVNEPYQLTVTNTGLIGTGSVLTNKVIYKKYDIPVPRYVFVLILVCLVAFVFLLSVNLQFSLSPVACIVQNTPVAFSVLKQKNKYYLKCF